MAGGDPEGAAGDPAGGPLDFDALYRTHVGRVVAYFERSGLAPADADDLAQQTFLRAFRGRATFDSARGSPQEWLAAIARNVARRHWRRRRDAGRFDPALAEDMWRAPMDPADSPETREEVRAVAECVEALPPDLIRIVRLRYVEGRTTRGMAEEIGMAEATVRLRLKEAHDLVARCLKAKGVLGSADCFAPRGRGGI
jgi:RNA polymerase sigma-70 factor (ECF subfamily)